MTRRVTLRRPHTLRSRLALGLAMVLLVGLVAAGVTTTLLLRGFLLGRLDGQLSDAGGRFSASLEHGQLAPGGSDNDADNAVDGQAVGTLGARLVGGRVEQAAVVTESGSNRTPVLSDRDQRHLAALHPGGDASTLHLDNLGSYRVQAVTGRDGDVQVTGLPLHEVDETVRRLVLVELSLAAAVTLAGAGVTALIVRRTLHPLGDVAGTALAVSRLPLTDPHTPLPEGIGARDTAAEIERVSTAFDHMLEHVRHALRARDLTEARLRQFVADASHELRTPLATVRAYTEYAQRADVTLPDATLAALARIDAAAQRMTTLVDDLLLLARLDAGRPLARETVDLSRLALDVVLDARTASPDHRWRLELPDDPVETTGDADRLHQVLVNLVGNARRHTPAGTTVTVAVRRDAAAGAVELEVRDDGPGIPPQLRETLFDRFSRADAARTAEDDTSTHGSGLGLAITRGIAVAHGGDVYVDSRPGLTRFVVRWHDA